MREQPKTGSLYGTDEKGIAEHQDRSLFDPVIAAGAEIKSHDSLASDTSADPAERAASTLRLRTRGPHLSSCGRCIR